MSWSPSTSSPVRSTASTRSASPSNARPASAPRSTTVRRRSAGWVEPQPSLMLGPSGSAWSTTTLGAEPAQHVGGDGRRRPVGAVDHEPQAGRVAALDRALDRLGIGEQVLRGRLHRADGVAGGRRVLLGDGPARSASSVASRARLDVVGELAAGRGEELDPVVRIAVVRRRDHGPGRAGLRRRPRHRRRRHDADRVDRRRLRR